MSLERVLGFFESKGMAERVLILDESSATVELAAHALHCPPERIAKTLSFLVGDRPVLVVMAGDAKVNNSKFKAVFKEKARMLTAEQAEALVGHAVGGVCPFAVNEGVQVYLDDSLKRFETVFPACGSDTESYTFQCHVPGDADSSKTRQSPRPAQPEVHSCSGAVL